MQPRLVLRKTIIQRCSTSKSNNTKSPGEEGMLESRIAMQKCAHAVKSLTLGKLECRYSGKAGSLLFCFLDACDEHQGWKCLGYASRTGWVDAAANHLEIFRLHKLHQPRSTALLSTALLLLWSCRSLQKKEIVITGRTSGISACIECFRDPPSPTFHHLYS